MKERPIIFSGAMVRAILAGTKTQTRRIVRGQKALAEGATEFRWGSSPSAGWAANDAAVREHAGTSLPCPYGAVGERMWVRESIRRVGEPSGEERWCESTYVADGAPTPADCWPWKNKALPAIHCPRGLSRITLEVTGVRVERLQDITEEDALAEGVVAGRIPSDEYGPERIGYVFGDDDGRCVLYPGEREAFAAGWDTINGQRAPWTSNPWVWAITFRRVP